MKNWENLRKNNNIYLKINMLLIRYHMTFLDCMKI
nr:MAG TPA: hypothetical protein [Herelleviridae sp.]